MKKKELGADSSFLIDIARIKLQGIKMFKVLYKMFEPVLITPKVKEEIIDKGKKRGKPDAPVVERELEEKRIKVAELSEKAKKLKEKILKDFGGGKYGIEEGEASAIALVKQEGLDFLGADDTQALEAGRAFGVKGINSGTVIVTSVTVGALSCEEGIKAINAASGLKPEIREEAKEDIKKFGGDKND